MAAKKKLYICPNCEKGFSSLSALNGHMGTCEPTQDPPSDKEDTTVATEEVSETQDDVYEAEHPPVDRVTIVKDEPDTGESLNDGDEPPIPAFIIFIFFILGGLALAFLLFREKIYELIKRGRQRPPAVADVTYA